MRREIPQHMLTPSQGHKSRSEAQIARAQSHADKQSRARARAAVKRAEGMRKRRLREAHVIDQGGCCLYCEQPFTADNPATLEHIIPSSKGGLTTALNTCASCRGCNSRRGTAHHAAFMRYMKNQLARAGSTELF